MVRGGKGRVSNGGKLPGRLGFIISNLRRFVKDKYFTREKIQTWRKQWNEKRESKRYVNVKSMKWTMRGYSLKCLVDLDEDLLVNKQRLKEMESKRTVHTAIWKAGPLAIIPATSLIVTINTNIIPPDNQEAISFAIVVSLGLIVFILLLSIYSWRRSISIDREIGLIEARLEEIQKTIGDRVVAIRADLQTYEREMVRNSDWENGIENLKFNEDLKNRVPFKIESRFGSRRYSDMDQRYHVLVSMIDLLSLKEENYLNLANSFYEKSKQAIMDADHEIGLNRKAKEMEELSACVKGCFFLYYREIKKSDDIGDVNKILHLKDLEINFIKMILEKKAINPYAKLLEDNELKFIVGEIKSEYNSCVASYIEVNDFIQYVLITGS